MLAPGKGHCSNKRKDGIDSKLLGQGTTVMDGEMGWRVIFWEKVQTVKEERMGWQVSSRDKVLMVMEGKTGWSISF